MRGFVIILCFAFLQAERLAQNHGQSGSHNAFESRFRNRFNSMSSPATSYSHNNRARSELNNGRGGYSADSVQSSNFAGPIAATAANYHKDFYSYAAPDEDFKDIEAAQQLALAARKNLRVVFIKAPENNALTNAAFQLAQKNAESRTAIYVLTKQTDVAELVNQLQAIQPSPDTKPEVHFVKYRTPEDAVRAQQIIQSEYDTLGGTSRVSNEGVAPVLDFSLKKEDLLSSTKVNSVNVGHMNNVAVMLNSYLPSKSRQ